MRPLFTIHAGEYVVGEFIEHNFPSLNIWVPTKDTGVDLLVTGPRSDASLSLQVKLSRDYRPSEAASDFDRSLVAGGWLTIDHEKLSASTADLWVIVVIANERKLRPQFIVVPPRVFLSKLVAVHGKSRRYNFYPWITKNKKCLDGRGLLHEQRRQLAEGTMVLGERDLSGYLENWKPLQRLAATRPKR